MKLNPSLASVILSFAAGFCFLLAFFFHQRTYSLILGILWICIGILALIKSHSKRK